MILKLNLLFALVFLPGVSSAKELQFDYFSPEQKKRITVTLVEHQGKKISKACFKNGKVSCLAWSALTNRKLSSLPERSLPLLGHPAAQNCYKHQAVNRLIKDKQKKEYDICYFKDGSFIDAWDLYNANN